MNKKEALAILAGEELSTGQQFYDARRVVCEAFAALPERLWAVPKVEWEYREGFDGRPFYRAKVETQVHVLPEGVSWYWRMHPNHDRLNFSGFENTLEQAQAAAESAYVNYITRGMVEVKRDG